MIKINTDYVAKHSKLETLKISSKLKSNLSTYLTNEFQLFDVDPKYITNINEIFAEKRNLTFDNYENNKIYELSPFINNQLLKYVNEFNLPVKTGVKTYSAIFNRDFNYSVNTTSHEFGYFMYIKDYLSEISENSLNQMVVKICAEINAQISDLGPRLKKLPAKMQITSIDKLLRTYPIVANDQLINYANTSYHLMLVYGVNGYNQRNYNYIDNKLSAFGKTTASLYVFSPINNTSLKILTISIPPTLADLNELIADKKYDPNKFDYAKQSLNEEYNCIGVEIYTSQLLMYIMQKFSINEIVDADQQMEIDKKFKNNFLL